MICYSLRCGAEHEFEAWFRDSAGYDEQRATGEVTCPVCGDNEVVKAPMAPAVPRKGNRSGDPVARRTEELAADVVEAVEKLREHVEANCDYVGDAFPDEARKIHYGEAEERGIYGETTPDEARSLTDEGIEVYSLPTVKRRPTN
ncbi:MAG: DUF1178 family protein [Rhodospirillales bacterium]